MREDLDIEEEEDLDIEEEEGIELEEPQGDSVETPEQIAENRKKRRYLLYGIIGSLLIIVILIVAFISSQSNKEALLGPEETDPNSPHPIVELAKIKNVPLQRYNVTTPLIANTPRELVYNLDTEGWSSGPEDYSNPGLSKTYSCIECPLEKIIDIWLRVYPNNQVGREELFSILEAAKKNNTNIVSEVIEMAGGGFIVNNNNTLSYWFYYEPNIIARVDMYQSKQGTLQETREWAHRLNYSIYRVVGR